MDERDALQNVYQSKWEHARDLCIVYIVNETQILSKYNRHNCTHTHIAHNPNDEHWICVDVLVCILQSVCQRDGNSAHMDILWFYVVQPKVFDQIKVCQCKSLIWSLAHPNAIVSAVAAELRSWDWDRLMCLLAICVCAYKYIKSSSTRERI